MKLLCKNHEALESPEVHAPILWRALRRSHSRRCLLASSEGSGALAADDKQDFSLKTVAITAFLPTLLFAIGESAVIPLIPIVASGLGASLPVAGLIGAMAMVGRLIGNIPSGWIVSRFGERNAMIGAASIASGGALVSVASDSYWVLALGVLLTGLATAVFALARHSFLTTFVPIHYRARALSTLGGIFRAGSLIGPFIAAGVITLTLNAQSVLWIFAACSIATIGVLFVLPDPSTIVGVRSAGTRQAVPTKSRRMASPGLFRTIWQERVVLARLGSASALIGAMRATRLVVLPLWAVSIGISEPNIALIIGIAGAIDFSLFYVGGHIMDRYGRVWGALPSMIGLGLGFIILSVSHDLPANVFWFITIAMLLGVANSLGSGLLLTLGSDLAPTRDPTPFLGAWRFVSDFGAAAAPLAVSGIAAVASLMIATGFMGCLGLVGALLLGRYIPRFLPSRE